MTADQERRLTEGETALKRAAAKFLRIWGYLRADCKPERVDHPILGRSLPSEASIYGAMKVFEVLTNAKALSQENFSLPDLMYSFLWDPVVREQVQSVLARRHAQVVEQIHATEARDAEHRELKTVECSAPGSDSVASQNVVVG